jgi:TatD DNase family protein
VPPELIDTHAHLDDKQLADETAGVVERARAAGVTHIITVATSAASTARCLAISSQFSTVLPTAGIHPNHAAEAAPGDWDEVVRLAASPKIVGIGETGLDRHWDDTPFPVQEDYFARHLELGRTLKRPVIIHCREAEADVLRMLRTEFEKHGPITAVMHSFAADAATAEACLAMGLHVSFAGMLTYKKNDELRKVASTIPADRLLVETDCPYLAPMPLRGKRNEPAFVVHTAVCLAQVRGITLEEIAAQTSRNARTLFGLTTTT